jgi:hypothetical protein
VQVAQPATLAVAWREYGRSGEGHGSIVAAMTGPSRLWQKMPVLRRRRLAADVDQLRDVVLHIQRVVETTNHQVVELAKVVEAMNHDMRAGTDESLPLFAGYVERLRLDADTAIAVSQAIERQVAELRDLAAGISTRADA